MAVAVVKAIEIRDPRWKEGQDGFEYTAWVTVAIDVHPIGDWKTMWRARWDHVNEDWRPR